ncbi:MAG: LamG domain-containing protein [Kiritimatiellales bacterium]|nr:LamG domain-containing protein [Kiritimatiellales bacterium]MCF7863776.1 LamG domain-containing protein [Kiritimatiellales bacterium]
MNKLLVTTISVVLMGLGSVSAELLVKYSFETGTAPTDTVGPFFSDGNAGPATFLTNGISGQALGFPTANTGWATAGISNSEFKITSDFTVTMWVNLNGAPATRTRLITTANANTGGLGWRLLLAGGSTSNSNKIAFEGGAINNTFTTLQDVQQGAWTFVALRYANDGNATATVLYESQLGGDTALVASNSASVASVGAMSYGELAVNIPRIGVTQSVTATPRFHGAFDEIRLYNTALTDGELSALFNSSTVVPQTAYEAWSNSYSLVYGPDGDDDSDGLSNLYEFGLVGDPTNSTDTGIAPTYATVADGGTNWFEYVYPQLSDPNSGLSYYLELTANLTGTWTNSGYTVAGTNITGLTADYVTNRVSTVDDASQFIRLKIELL